MTNKKAYAKLSIALHYQPLMPAVFLNERKKDQVCLAWFCLFPVSLYALDRQGEIHQPISQYEILKK